MSKSDLGLIFSDEMTFDEVEEKVSGNPVLIIPLGGFEPLGNQIPLGLINSITKEVAYRIAIENECISAPVVNFGYTVPFSSFEGVFAVKKNIMESMVRNLVIESSRWGIKKILLLNFTTIPSDFFSQLEKSIKKKLSLEKLSFFDFQNDLSIRKLLLDNKKNDIRLEKAILSIALCLNLIKADKIESCKEDKKDEYSKWRRRGRDPELFRKKFPGGTVCTDLNNCSIAEGESLLEEIAKRCHELLSVEGCN